MVLAVHVRHFYLFQTRDFGTYRICEQRRLRCDCTSVLQYRVMQTEILQRGSVSDRPTEAAQHQVQAGGRRRLD